MRSQSKETPLNSIIVLNVHPSFRLDLPEPTTWEPFKPAALYEVKVDTNRRCRGRSQLQCAVLVFGTRAGSVGAEGEVIVQQAPVSVGTEALVTQVGNFRFLFGWRSSRLTRHVGDIFTVAWALKAIAAGSRRPAPSPLAAAVHP